MAGNRMARKFPAWMTKTAVVDDDRTRDENKSNFGLMKDESKQSIELRRDDSKPSLTFQGIIKYCPTIDDMGLACEDLIAKADLREDLILGFDAEWPVYYRGGSGKISLIQVCCEETTCYLFHVSFMRALPKIFLQLIHHPNVKLVGNCIKNDIWKLGRDYNVRVASIVESDRVVDLGRFANEVLSCGQQWSLDRLALHLMSVTIDKTDSIRKSKWNLELSAEQRLYAATDAYVSLVIYNKLKAKQALSI